MNILVVGSGGREHAIVWKLLQNPRVREVYVAPGNAGTGLIARNLDVPADDIPGLLRAAIERRIDLTVVGPEVPLTMGIVDAFRQSHMPIFGPTAAAARIEGSKAYAKELMERLGIPCARSATFSDYSAALDYVQQHGAPIVVKADGLAAGKGVTVCTTTEDAGVALQDRMIRRIFGSAGDRVVLEEYLEGPEVSLLAFTDGQSVTPMAPACDYKRVFDGDAGPNTGGMGSYSPAPFFGPEQVAYVQQAVLEPVVRALAEAGTPYVGVLYAGLMVTRDGIKVIEFNCRFGDPETQVILPLLKTDLVDIMQACSSGRLASQPIQWDTGACVGVVMASEGYPESYKTGYPVTGLDQLDDGVRVFHAGTTTQQMQSNTGLRRLWATDLPSPPVEELLSGGIQTAGGRVLTVVATGPDLAVARQKAYDNVSRVQFAGAHYRTDIGLPREIPEEWLGPPQRQALPAPEPAT
ncbi:MAG: phosphoribosylamine--glycine ligase [Chloroflexi bacterium]|nr:phosphoribosylamine--glycine ligase [Chloroflexota bacterium]